MLLVFNVPKLNAFEYKSFLLFEFDSKDICSKLLVSQMKLDSNICNNINYYEYVDSLEEIYTSLENSVMKV